MPPPLYRQLGLSAAPHTQPVPSETGRRRLGRQLAGLPVKAGDILPPETEVTPVPSPGTGDTGGPGTEQTFQEGTSAPYPPSTSSSLTGSQHPTPSCTVNRPDWTQPHQEKMPFSLSSRAPGSFPASTREPGNPELTLKEQSSQSKDWDSPGIPVV